MNFLKVSLLWLAAVVIATWAYLRLRRGKITLLEGRFSPALLRMIAVVLVYFNGGCPEPRLPNAATASPSGTQPTSASALPASAPVLALVAAPKDFPADFDAKAMYQLREDFTWRELTRRLEALALNNTEANLNNALSSVASLRSQALKDALTRKLERQRDGETETLAQLNALLDVIEKGSLYHPWLIGYLWRDVVQLTGESSAPLGAQDGSLGSFLGRLEYQQRVLHSLLLAEAAVGPVTFAPWRSKAMPTPGYNPLSIPAGLVEYAKKRFPATDAGTWASEAVLTLAVQSAPTEAAFLVGGELRGVVGTLRLYRFSLVTVPTSASSNLTLQHATLGTLTVAPGQTMTAWNVKNFISPKEVAALQALIDQALHGDAAVLSELEAVLPAVEDLLREAVAKDPTAKGAPALRTLLTLFDE